MSRTDSTDPYWVHRARYGTINHDHRSGDCVSEDGSRPVRHALDHFRYCPRWTRIEVPCTQMAYCYRRELLEEQVRPGGRAPAGDCGRPHVRWQHDQPDRPCSVCDAVIPTCTLEIPWHERYGRYWAHPPAWWRHHVTHGRNRNVARVRLSELRKEWNSRGADFDEDDWDVPVYTRSNANEYWD